MHDYNSLGKENDWKKKKRDNLKYAKLLDIFDMKHAAEVYQCSSTLKFLHDLETGRLKLKEAYFCKRKICPICAWRRSMKNSFQLNQIMEVAMNRCPKARYLFLTLSVRNVWDGKELSESMSEMTKAFSKLMRRRKVERNVLGFVRATEVTISDDPKKPEWKGSYNQHIHVLLMVKSTYFKDNKNYITQEEWQSMWKDSLKIDYKPMVNIKIVKNRNGKGSVRGAILETAKYPVKPPKLDYSEESEKIVRDLEIGLRRKRQLAFGGVLKDIKKELQLKDVENDDDLIHTSGEDDEEELTNAEILVAQWDWQRKNYYWE